MNFEELNKELENFSPASIEQVAALVESLKDCSLSDGLSETVDGGLTEYHYLTGVNTLKIAVTHFRMANLHLSKELKE